MIIENQNDQVNTLTCTFSILYFRYRFLQTFIDVESSKHEGVNLYFNKSPFWFVDGRRISEWIWNHFPEKCIASEKQTHNLCINACCQPLYCSCTTKDGSQRENLVGVNLVQLSCWPCVIACSLIEVCGFECNCSQFYSILFYFHFIFIRWVTKDARLLLRQSILLVT